LTTSTTSVRSAEPFSVAHFRAYAAFAILDNGRPFLLEPFQEQIAQDIFSGVPETWLVLPEGSGKTTFLGLLALYYGDYTPSAMIPIAASSREQAEILYRQAEGLVVRSPELKTRFRAYGGYRRIKCLRTEGRIQVFAADDRTGDGIIPGGLALIDELHRHRDLRLYRTWKGKLDKRDAQLVTISTAGEPETEFELTRELIKRDATDLTVDGSHVRACSDGLVLHDWSVPPGRDVNDMAVVKAANPFSGVTVEHLTRKRNSPTMTLGHWQRFVCNQATRSEGSAIGTLEWAHLAGEGIPEGVPVWLGADFGWKWDTTALSPLWMPEPERRVFGIPEVITPPRDGSSTDPEEVQEAFRRLHARNPVHTVVMDENAGGAQIAGWIEQELGARVISHSQGNVPMALAYERFMEALREGWLSHPEDREFTRHVLNAIVKVLPGGTARFDRPSRARNESAQDRRVWDALTAACMVHSVAVAEMLEPVVSREVAFL
jgi:phage terminase large subunit-like protein